MRPAHWLAGQDGGCWARNGEGESTREGHSARAVLPVASRASATLFRSLSANVHATPPSELSLRMRWQRRRPWWRPQAAAAECLRMPQAARYTEHHCTPQAEVLCCSGADSRRASQPQKRVAGARTARQAPKCFPDTLAAIVLMSFLRDNSKFLSVLSCQPVPLLCGRGKAASVASCRGEGALPPTELDASRRTSGCSGASRRRRGRLPSTQWNEGNLICPPPRPCLHPAPTPPRLLHGAALV